MIKDRNTQIAIIGLGYVGLPLEVEFSKQYNTIGFDVNQVLLSYKKAEILPWK